MKIKPFATEQYYARYEFSTPHLLSVSDCETMSIAELIQMANVSLEDMGRVRLGYTESQGDPALRETVANTYDKVPAEQVVILNSPVEGIYLALQALLEPEDEVIVLAPAYDALINVAEHVSRRVHRWPIVSTATGWELDLEALTELVNPKTKMIVVNFPHNPTGYLPTRNEFEAIVGLAREEGIWLFYDEMYRGLEHGGRPRLPSAADSYERSIVLSGLSKTYGLPGLRAGWLVIPSEEVRQTIMNWKHYTSICPAAPTEFLALAALSIGDELAQRSQALIKQNLQLAEPFFARWQGFFHWRPPMSGSVALVGIDVPSATNYCHHLAEEAGVLLLPATFMGSDEGHVRFGFGRRSFPSALSAYEAYLDRVVSTKNLKPEA